MYMYFLIILFNGVVKTPLPNLSLVTLRNSQSIITECVKWTQHLLEAKKIISFNTMPMGFLLICLYIIIFSGNTTQTL